MAETTHAPRQTSPAPVAPTPAARAKPPAARGAAPVPPTPTPATTATPPLTEPKRPASLAPSGAGASPVQPDAGPGIEAVLDAVFITPRVIDQRTLEDFGGSLRTLVREAATQHALLAACAGEVRQGTDAARQALAELRQTIAVRPQPSRPEPVRAAAPRPEPAGIDPGALAALVREQVAKALREAGVGPGPAPIAAPIAARTGVASPAALAPGGAVEETLERVRRAHAALDRASDEAVVRVAGLHEQVEAARTRADLAQRALDESAAAAEVRVAAGTASAERAVALLGERAGEAATRLGAALAQAERRAASVTTDVEAMLANFERRAELIAARAAGAIGPEPGRRRKDDPTSPAPAEAPADPDRARLTQQMIAAGEALDALAARAEAIRREALGHAPELDARASRLQDAVREATRVGDALAALVAQARAVGDAHDRARRGA